MKSLQDFRSKGPRHYFWMAATVGIAVLLVAAAIFYETKRAPQEPHLLNEPTKAREARPFSKEPDARFAPLPFEREKHGR